MLVRMWSNKNSPLWLVGMQNGTATLEDSLEFLTKLSAGLPYNPEMVLLGIHLNELKTYVHTKTYTQMFIATLFIVVKN